MLLYKSIMELVGTLYWVIGLLSIFLIAAVILGFAEKQATPTGYQEKAFSKSLKGLTGKSEYEILTDMINEGAVGLDANAITNSLLKHAEITRRLIVELRRFNQSTTWLTLALIFLGIVQIILAVVKP